MGERSPAIEPSPTDDEGTQSRKYAVSHAAGSGCGSPPTGSGGGATMGAPGLDTDRSLPVVPAASERLVTADRLELPLLLLPRLLDPPRTLI